MMTIISKLEYKIKKIPIGKVVPFSSIELEGVSKDTIRKYLHRLDAKGVIAIQKRGYFKRIEPFSEFLFVYGSLKKGFDNHTLLQKYAKRVAKASTIKKFAMYEDSFGNYPYIIDKPISRIIGELYEIRQRKLLQKIDEFEGAPEYYQRRRIKVKTHQGVHFAYIYIRENEEAPLDQKPLKEWKNDVEYKVKKLDAFLENFYE